MQLPASTKGMAHRVESPRLVAQVDERDFAALELDSILQQTTIEQGGALCFDSVHGVWLYDGAALRNLLEHRWNVCTHSFLVPDFA